MIYAIFLCIASVGCHQLGEPVHTYTFDTQEACLAKLPVVMVRGKSVSADGRLYVNNQEWLQCAGKQTWQAVTPSPAAPTSAPIKRVPYVLRHCIIGGQCQDSSVTSISQQACEFSMQLVAGSSNASDRYECVRVP